MHSKTIVGLIFVTVLSAFADRPHDIFKENSDKILSSDITIIGDFSFVVGKAKSQGIGGDSVGWTKAEMAAMSCLGDVFKKIAQWPDEATEEEKKEAWVEYRASKIKDFEVVGLQRVYSKKLPPDNYLLVLSVPTKDINVAAPKRVDLEKALSNVRERKKAEKEAGLREEMQIKKEEESKKRRAGYREETQGVIKQQQVDEDLIL